MHFLQQWLFQIPDPGQLSTEGVGEAQEEGGRKGEGEERATVEENEYFAGCCMVL